MHIREHVGFWSYTHRDNDLDDGRIARLAKDISDEFELQTGETLRMFLDSNSIEWGDEWRQSINQAMDHAVFFIAIITPLYVRSIECRREFLAFMAQLQSSEPARILLPILYTDRFTGAESAAEDPIVQMVQRTQYEDWRKLRLSDCSSAAYRRAVHGMAVRIIDICQRAYPVTET